MAYLGHFSVDQSIILPMPIKSYAEYLGDQGLCQPALGLLTPDFGEKIAIAFLDLGNILFKIH